LVVLPIIAQVRLSLNASLFVCRVLMRPHGFWSHSNAFARQGSAFFAHLASEGGLDNQCATQEQAMSTVICGAYATAAQSERVIQALLEAGTARPSISVIPPETVARVAAGVVDAWPFLDDHNLKPHSRIADRALPGESRDVLREGLLRAGLCDDNAAWGAMAMRCGATLILLRPAPGSA
jgi:hypothetical protein